MSGSLNKSRPIGVGYTAKQAQRLKDRLDLQMAKAEDAVAGLGRIVPDTNVNLFFGVHELESLREQVDVLKSIVDRRTR